MAIATAIRPAMAPKPNGFNIIFTAISWGKWYLAICLTLSQ